MHYKFIAVRYGKVKLPSAGWAPIELTDLNWIIEGKYKKGAGLLPKLLKDGWSIKQFFIHTPPTGNPIFVLMLEKP